MEEKPRINELKENGLKFIQIYIKCKPYIRFGEKKGYHHCNILDEILKEFDIKYETRKSETSIIDIPLEKGENYELVGAGRAEKIEYKRIFLYDSSGDYYFGPNTKHFKEISKHLDIKFTCEELYKEELFNKNAFNDDLPF